MLSHNSSTALKWILMWLSLTINGAHLNSNMTCKYVERGSLTAICTNAIPSFFRNTSYKFDHMDESLQCINCNLTNLQEGTFDIPGNRLQLVNLTDSLIRNIEKKAFTGLEFLNTLYLTGNYIRDLSNEAFFGVRKLEFLYLNHALDFLVLEDALQDLRSLRELFLRNNHLAVISPTAFKGLDRLELLDLSNNLIIDLVMSLSTLKALKVVNLNSNILMNISSIEFKGLRNLLNLDLSYNRISLLDLDLGLPNQLRKLNLAHNDLGSHVIKPGAFKNLEHLEILDLSFNNLTEILPKLFHGMYSLRELLLSHNRIIRFSTGTFSGLPLLQFIDLSHNYIESAEITGRVSLRQVHVVDFTDNKIRDFDFVQFVLRVPSISVVLLKNNPMSCKTRTHLAAYFHEENLHLEVELDNCPELPQEELKRVSQEIDSDVSKLNQPPTAIYAMKVTFLMGILGLVGGLFYVQFMILNRRQRNV